MSEEYMTKKELLIETNISYGQLYRWKRDGLIPEKWFVKRSSFTGQETVFPKNLILERIEHIQDLKSEMSHEDISKLFAGEDNKITVEDLKNMNIIDDKVLEAVNNIYSGDIDIHIATLIGVMSKAMKTADINFKQVKPAIERVLTRQIPIKYKYMDMLTGDKDIKMHFKNTDECVLYDDYYNNKISICFENIRQEINMENNLRKQV